MDQKYYTHFVLTELDGQGFGEFTGIVHVGEAREGGIAEQEARRMLAENLDVSAEDVHVIHWSQLH